MVSHAGQAFKTVFQNIAEVKSVSSSIKSNQKTSMLQVRFTEIRE